MAEPSRRAELPAGPILYREAGEGPPVVFVHGYLVDGHLWDGVLEALSDRCRCIVPDWPMGAHRVAMAPDADLTPPGFATLIDSFLAELDLDGVTLVGNDSGGAMAQILAAERPRRLARLVLTNCDTHENFPPSVFRALPRLAAMPGGMAIIAAPFRVGAIARAAFRPFARTRIPSELVASWMEPAVNDPGVRRDLQKLTAGMHRRHTLAAAERLRGSDLPILLAWAPGDRWFPISYAERIEADAANARLVRIPDSATFVPLDQPRRLADEIAAFAAA